MTAALTIVLMVCATAAPASAKPSGVQDGQILYELYDPQIDDLVPFTVNPDGSNARQVFDQAMECPYWSPTGTQIASCGGPASDTTTILTVDTGQTRFLPSVAPDLTTPCYVWSSDAQRLACEGFSDDDPSHNGIFTVRVSDWSDARRLTTNPGGDIPGDYSPNSRQLVFGRNFVGEEATPALFRINVNGTGLRRLTPTSMAAISQGSWSPRGNEILFSGRNDFERRQSLWVVHADGSDLHQLTVGGIPCGGRFDDPNSLGCSNPTWSPTGAHIAFKINSTAGSTLERADADGSNARFVVDLGPDPGDVIDWGTHRLVAAP